MKKLFCSVAVAASLFAPVAYSQQSVLSCVVKTVSGSAKTKQVGEIAVGTTLTVPIDALRANGSSYEGYDLLNTERYGESTTFIVSRETGAFELSASDTRNVGWATDGLGYATSGKKARGNCTVKKMKL
ncbi:hypothetical protein ACNHE5_10795 [Pandoraea pnomenusa]|uniref:hypothetical protein n=1 Tax=Pandoraea pnomenusa TaxID=93220 RepID=UPI003CF3A4A5